MADVRTMITITLDVNPEKVRVYLLNHGWVDKGPYTQRGRLFENEDYFQAVVLPIVDTVADFSLRMSELFQTLARSEQRPLPDILGEMGLNWSPTTEGKRND